MRVMIVEDQTMIRSLLESYFRVEDGYRITASIPGAKQAVEVCRTNSVDLILMDVQTENRENGLTQVPGASDLRMYSLTSLSLKFPAALVLESLYLRSPYFSLNFSVPAAI